MLELAFLANAMVTSLAWLYVVKFRDSEPVFSPLVAYLAFHTFLFVFRPLVFAGTGSEEIWAYMLFQPDEIDLARTHVAATVGLLFYAFGYIAARMTAQHGAIHADRFAETISGKALLLTWSTLGAIAVYSALFIGSDVLLNTGKVVTERVGAVVINKNTNGYFVEAQYMLIGLCAMTAVYARFSLMSLSPTLVFFTYRTMVGWGRWSIVLTALALYYLWLSQNNRRWPRWKAVAIATPLILIFMLLGQDREYFRDLLFVGSGETSKYHFASIGDTVRDGLSGLDFANFEYLTYVIHHVPDSTNTYTYGTQYLQMFTEPIPRVIWQGKPAGLPVQMFDLNDYGNFLGLTISNLGDGWINFGWLGVAITLGITGYILGVTFSGAIRYWGSAFVRILYLSFAALFVQFFRDGSIVSVMKFSGMVTLPILVVFALSRRFNENRLLQAHYYQLPR